MDTNLISYYDDRAEEYDNIYAKPERQGYLESAAVILKDIFKGKKVIEIACGTGYWTQCIAESAASIFATDINKSVINVAQKKKFLKENVSFALADFYHLRNSKSYEGLFGGFIWSHIPLHDIDRFLISINGAVAPGSVVVFMDNFFVSGNNSPVTYTDDQGNSFQTRKLQNGKTYRILKNFPTESFLEAKLKNFGKDVQVINLNYYWIASFITPGE